MRILFLCHSFNSLSQRLFVELRDLGHEVSVEFDINDAVALQAVDSFAPDIVLAPFLKRAIPRAIWENRICLVVHPGPVGDGGPSALDWAILNGERDWGVTVLQAEEALDAARDVVVTHNADHYSGNLSSLRTGVDAAPEAEAVVLILGDMPGVTPEIINAKLDAWNSHHPWAAVASYTDGEGHPLLLSRAAIDHSLRLEGPKPLWRMLRLAPNGEVMHIEIDVDQPMDIDTPDDYERLLETWPRPGTPAS